MKRYIIAGVAILLFLHHIVCTVLYNAPLNPLTNCYQQHVTQYMEPLFAQKWLLFAPDPATNDLKLWYRVKSGNVWSSWYDPVEPILKKHQRIRFTYNAKLLYVYENIPRTLSRTNDELNTTFRCLPEDARCRQLRKDSLAVSPAFLLAKRYVQEDAMKSLQVKPDSIQFMIIQLYVRQYSERLSNKPFGYANATEFDPIAFDIK